MDEGTKTEAAGATGEEEENEEGKEENIKLKQRELEIKRGEEGNEEDQGQGVVERPRGVKEGGAWKLGRSCWAVCEGHQSMSRFEKPAVHYCPLSILPRLIT